MSTMKFDIDEEFSDRPGELGIDAGEISKVTFTREDPIFNNSIVRLGAAFAIPAVLGAAAIAAIWCDKAGRKQDIRISLHEAGHGLNPHETRCSPLNGFESTAPVADGNPFLHAPYRTVDGRDIFCLAVYPHLERKWLSFLPCGPAVDQVSAYDRARKVAFPDGTVSVPRLTWRVPPCAETHACVIQCSAQHDAETCGPREGKTLLV